MLDKTLQHIAGLQAFPPAKADATLATLAHLGDVLFDIFKGVDGSCRSLAHSSLQSLRRVPNRGTLSDTFQDEQTEEVKEMVMSD